jgi:hypothetical protein
MLIRFRNSLRTFAEPHSGQRMRLRAGLFSARLAISYLVRREGRGDLAREVVGRQTGYRCSGGHVFCRHSSECQSNERR